MKRLVIDLDGTLAGPKTESYSDCPVIDGVAAQVRSFKKLGFEIVIATARNMRTFDSSMGRITANTVPGIIEWLTRNDIPYDEIWVGKPWCGTEGFYVDDRSIRPDEFASLSYDEIRALIGDVPDDQSDLG